MDNMYPYPATSGMGYPATSGMGPAMQGGSKLSDSDQ